jgi:flagellar FliL protein
MATKAKSKEKEAPAEAPAAGGGKKKMIIIILAAILASSAAAGGAVWFLGRSSASASASAKASSKAKAHASTPAVFLPLEPFTVNLQSEGNDQFLQVTISLQVADAPTAEQLKANIAIVRNRILILLSSKKASEVASVEGKEALAADIVKKVKEPFVHDGGEQEVMGALFTSFIVQ